MILLLHNRYRTTGGEERAVDDFAWLVREHLGEDAEVLERDSVALSRPRAAVAMLRGGLQPDDVAAAVRRTGARIVHAHNLNPSFGWRALAAARRAGAGVVLHLHNYRLVCAVGTCFTRGADCARCHGRDTLPGVRLACRGDRAEAAVYGAGLTAWQRRLAAQVDRFVVPSHAALERLRELAAPVDGRATVVAHPVRHFAAGSAAADGEYALVASRLAPEKGVNVAIEAARRAARPLVVVGDGPLRGPLRQYARGAEVTFHDAVGPDRFAKLRRGAAVRSSRRGRPRRSGWPPRSRWRPARPWWQVASGRCPSSWRPMLSCPRATPPRCRTRWSGAGATRRRASGACGGCASAARPRRSRSSSRPSTRTSAS